MKRLFPLFALVLVVGCNKPSDDSCRKAIRNMRALMGTDSPTNMTDIEGDVRRCKGGSTKKAVECAGRANSLDELRACDFMKIPKKTDTTGSDTTGSAPPAGSGTATTGSAGAPTMAGSDSTGSAATGSATGSDSAGSATGSAAGSATGSAAGSAAGSGSAK